VDTGVQNDARVHGPWAVAVGRGHGKCVPSFIFVNVLPDVTVKASG